MGGVCFCPYTLSAFRDWLRQRYPRLETLNQAWLRSFRTWEEVTPETLEQARQRGQFGAWLDHTLFMEASYADRLAFVRAAIQEMDPTALVGEDGFGRLDAYDGADWWRLLGICGFCNLYTYQDPPQMEITRSLAPHFPNVQLRTLYYGSYDGQFGNPRFLRLIPWYALLHGYNGLFWWVANGKTTYPGTTNALAGPDFRPTASFMASKAGVDEIRNGLIQLIAPAQRQHDGIAILYDHDAVRAATALGHPSELVRSLQAFQDLTEDLGLQYKYVAGPQVRDGILRQNSYRVLILAQARACAPAVAAEVRQFVETGGALITDTVPATHDARLQPAAAGSLLAGLFGAPGETTQARKGKALLLNQPLGDYSHRRREAEGRRCRDTVAPLLRGDNSQLFATLSPAPVGEAAAPEIELITFARGEARIVAVLNHGPTEVSRTLTVSQPWHVYAVRSRSHLGRRQTWDLTVPAGDALLYALLPYEVAGVEITATAQSATRGAAWPFAVRIQPASGAPTSCHSFIVEVLGPDRQPQPARGSVLSCRDAAPAAGTILFALNDAPGAWTVRVTDAVSGRTCTRDLVVR
jgi:hypothetical protein